MDWSLENDFESQLELEVECFADYQEGLTAFLEKRKPVFTGK